MCLTLRSDGDILGRRRVYRRRQDPRHSAPAWYSAVRHDRSCLGDDLSRRRVRLPHQPVERLIERCRCGCFFLVAHESLAGAQTERSLGSRGAAAGAIIGAFTFTAWQNSNETEVYAVATFTIGAMSLACLPVETAARDTERDADPPADRLSGSPLGRKPSSRAARRPGRGRRSSP